MNLLAIDTSTEYLSLAVTRGDKVAAKMHRKAPMMHSTLLVPMIAGLLKKAKLKPKDLDGFCVSVGPGSFTGLRIGVTTIKGLAYSLNKPVVAVPTLDVIAENAKDFKGVICPVLDARKNKVYACIYKSDGKKIRKISRYLLISVPELEKILSDYGKIVLLGDGIRFFAQHKIKFAKWHPRADVVARFGLELFKKKKSVPPRQSNGRSGIRSGRMEAPSFISADKLEPMYLYSRECDITGK